MKYITPVLLIFVVIGAGLYAVKTQAAPTATQAAAIMAPVMTFTPSPVPSPTIDSNATMAVERNAAINAAEVSRRAELDAEQHAIYAVQTAQAANVAALCLTVTIGAQSIEMQSLRVTEGAVNATRQAAAIADRNNAATATADAPRSLLAAKQAEADAKTATMLAYSRPASNILLSIAALIFAIALITVVFRRPVAPVIQEPARIWMAPNSTVRDMTPPGDRAQFARFAEYALSGGTLGINRVCDVEKLYTRAEYVAMIAWMQDNSFIAPVNGGVRLSEAGRAFMAALPRWNNDPK